MENAFEAANGAVYRTAQAEASCQGMGTTVVSALFHADRITVAHVGDSRLYRLRDKTFEQLTTDHSLIQELIDRGIYTPEEAPTHTPKNLVTRALGIDKTVAVDILEEKTYPNDLYMLCTDGLNDMMDDEEIHLTLNRYSVNLEAAARQLIKLANEKGGKDNISIILARLRGDRRTNAGWVSKLRRRFS
jgi:protein phosphatase